MKSVFEKSTAAAVLALSLAACAGESSSAATVSSSTLPTSVASSSVDSSDEDMFSLVRSTTFGDVEGTHSSNALVWYAIPYGAAPVGELRWQAPQDPEPWTDVKDCTQPGEKAIQYVTDSTTNETTATGIDDCLNLDVYTTEGAEDLPVLVFIHGGNNQSGNAQEIVGEQIVERDNCVYVSLTYRLGLLGFNILPALQEEGKSNNFTMLDIAKALDWIKENISTFGGDPENITVSGFSAGGRDVMAMLISPVFKDKFQKAIAFSGGMTTADVNLSAEKTAKLMANLAIEDGKAQDEAGAVEFLMTDSDEVRDYLYGIDSARLAAAVGNASIRMSAFPHHFTDGIVIPTEGFDTAEYNDVPLMMLTGSTEFSFFNNFDGSFNAIENEDLRNRAVAFGNKYGSDMYRIFNAQMSAEKMADKYTSDIYIAQVDFGGANSAVEVPMFGAFHGIFVPMLSDVNGYASIFDFASHQGYQAMAEEFNVYLANFLASGDPNGDGMTEWTAWTPESKISMVFDADETSAKLEGKDVSTTYDAIMDAMDADDTIDAETKGYVIENSMNGRWFSDALHARYNTTDLWN